MSGPDEPSGDKEALLQKALDQLSPKLKACFILGVIENLPYQEISKILEIPVGTIKSRMNSARQKIEEFLNQNRTF